MGSPGDNVTIRFETNNEGPWMLHWFVNLSTHIWFPIINCSILDIQPYRLAFEFVSDIMAHDFIVTEMTTFSRGFAAVFAQDVPAIAKTHPPRNFTYCLRWISADLNSLFSCLEWALPKVPGVLAWDADLINLIIYFNGNNYITDCSLSIQISRTIIHISLPYILFPWPKFLGLIKWGQLGECSLVLYT